MDLRIEVSYELTEITHKLLSKVRQEIGEKILKLNTPCGISQLYSKKNEKDGILIFYINVSIHEEYEFKQNKNNEIVKLKKKRYSNNLKNNENYIIVDGKIKFKEDKDGGIYKEIKTE